MNGLPEADARIIAPAPVAENLMVYLDAQGHVWARNPATGIARHLTGKMPPVEDYLLIDGTRPMLGLLTLVDIAPIIPEHATNKRYVDGGYRRLQDQIDLLLAGQVFIGSYDVVGDLAIFISSIGLPSGPLPPASTFLAGHYLICISAGLGQGEAPPDLFGVGDQIFSDGTDWVHVKVGGPVVTAFQVALVPQIGPWENVQEGLNGLFMDKVSKAGDVMLGPLFLPAGVPTNSDQAVTKAYVDLVNTNAVQKIGDTMTGPLMLPMGDLMNNVALQIGNQYLGISRTFVMGNQAVAFVVGPNVVAGSFSLNGLAMSGNAITGMANPMNAQDAATKSYVDTNVNTINSNLANRVLKTGDTMSGALLLPFIDPLRPEEAASKNYVDTQRNSRVAKTGDSMTGALTVIVPHAGDPRWGSGNQGLRLHKTDNTTGNVAPSVQWNDAAGNGIAFIRGRQSGGFSYYATAGLLEAWQSNQGYSQVRIFTTRNNAWTPDMMFEGTVYARGSALTSDATLKTRIAAPDPDDVERAFAALRPVRFHWKPGEVPNPLAAPEGKSQLADPEPDRLEWGFLAQDIEVGIPDAVHDGGEGKKAYELANVVAVLTAKVKQLEEERSTLRKQVDELQAIVGSIAEQLATLEERFSNKILSDMEAQVQRMREQAAKPNQVRQSKPRQLPE